MFTNHFDIFNKAINDFDGPANERESILWHENDMYDFAKAYLDGIDDMSSHDVDLTLRYMRYDIEAIAPSGAFSFAYVELCAKCELENPIDRDKVKVYINSCQGDMGSPRKPRGAERK